MSPRNDWHPVRDRLLKIRFHLEDPTTPYDLLWADLDWLLTRAEGDQEGRDCRNEEARMTRGQESDR